MSSENLPEDSDVSSSLPLSDESSDSALHSFSNDFRTALEEFRDNWQRELKDKKDSSAPAANAEAEEQIISTGEPETKAESLFRQAVELEQRGKVYDALPLYRKALQIDSNIEFKYYEQQKHKIPNNAEINTITHSTVQDGSTTAEEEYIDNLYEKFQFDLTDGHGGKLISSSRDAGVISTERHISDLPPEILMYILRWVVSTHLDMRSLEQCAAVCKGMYICARDDDLWRLACMKVWGLNVGTPSNPIITPTEQIIESADTESPLINYSSWRQMFIERERVLFNGCYISKTTYLRMGENSFQDQFYRPVQLVEYYRYIRFFPDGQVIMMTNADEPSVGVTKLKSLNQIRPDVLRGHYSLLGSTVSILLEKKQRVTNHGYQYARHRRALTDEYNHTKYCIELRIMSTPKRKLSQLVWSYYSIAHVRNKIEATTIFDLTSSRYPPLWFSPVRSYHLDTDAPIA